MHFRDRHPTRTPVALAALLLMSCAATQASAQAATPPADAASAPAAAPADATPTTAPAPAPAASEATGGKDQPQTVVISAQKRTERLKDTPVAAAVLSADAIAKANVTEISSLNTLVPSVELKGSFNGRVPMAMRGISTNANEAAVGLTSGVSLMIDGIPVPSDSTAANELTDLMRVEVLKGPQSTLGGRTASAGVINFVTNTPSRKHWVASGSGTLTNDGERRGDAFVSGPLSDTFAFSASLFDNHRLYPIYNTILQQHSGSDSRGGRVKLLFAPDPSFDVTLAARASDTASHGETFTYQYVTPGAGLFPFFPWAPTGVDQSTALGGISPHYGNMDYASPVHMSARSQDRDVSLNIDKRIGDYTLTSTTAKQTEKQHNVQDVPMAAVYFLDVLRQGVIPDPSAGGPPLFDDSQSFDLKPTQFTQEFKIASPANQAVSYVAGLFYSDSQVQYDETRTMFVNPIDNHIHSTTKSLGLYGRATWTLADRSSLLTGLRVNRDDVGYRYQDLTTINGGPFYSTGDDKSTTTVGDLTFRQKFGNDQTAYVTYARGYKPRAYNTAQLLSSNDPLVPVDKERISHFEIGGKFGWLKDTATLNVAAFDTEYKNYQVQIYDHSSVISVLQLSNAGQARTRGLELDGTLRAAENTSLNASLAFIDATFQRYDGAPCYPGQTAAQGCTTDTSGNSSQSLAGKTMPDSPKFKATVGLTQSFEIPGTEWRFSGDAQYAYRTSANFQADQNPQTRQGGFGILNLGLSAFSPDDHYSVRLFVDNATNKFYLTNAEDFFSGLWGSSTNAVIGQPARDARRYYGVKLSVDFD